MSQARAALPTESGQIPCGAKLKSEQHAGADRPFRAVTAGLVFVNIMKKTLKSSEARKLPKRHRSYGLSITRPPPYVVNYKAEGDIL